MCSLRGTRYSRRKSQRSKHNNRSPSNLAEHSRADCRYETEITYRDTDRVKVALINEVSPAIASANSFFFMHNLQKTCSLFTDLEGNMKSLRRGTLRWRNTGRHKYRLSKLYRACLTNAASHTNSTALVKAG